MIAAFPFHSGDIKAAHALMKWIRQLGGCKGHNALLVAEAGTDWIEVMEIRKLAEGCFSRVWMTATDKPVKGWPQGPNSMFRAAAECVENDLHEPFFFCETDCIPLKKGWLDDLDRAYRVCGKPFMGALVDCELPGLPKLSLAGSAVYPPDAASRLRAVLDAQSARAWDVASAEVAVPQSASTSLIQHFWGQPQLPPTFAEKKWPDSPRNVFTLARIHSEAVVFHRNKDGTLIRLLRRSLFGDVAPKMSVVLAFCNKDSALALKVSHWMLRICPASGYSMTLSVDRDTDMGMVNQAVKDLSGAFSPVSVYKYRCGSTFSWPQGANTAFRNTAYHMQQAGAPFWLWLEPDAIPTRGCWLDDIQTEYELGQKLFMGPIVQGMGHMNGVGVYPKDTPDYIPNALNIHASNLAWDSVMRDEMIWECHDAEPLIQHVWGIVNGMPHPCLGNAASFASQEEVRSWVHPRAVIFHRCKDGSLIDRLSEIRK